MDPNPGRKGIHFRLEGGSGSRILFGEIGYREMQPYLAPSLSTMRPYISVITIWIRIRVGRVYTLGLKVDPDPEYC